MPTTTSTLRQHPTTLLQQLQQLRRCLITYHMQILCILYPRIAVGSAWQQFDASVYLILELTLIYLLLPPT